MVSSARLCNLFWRFILCIRLKRTRCLSTLGETLFVEVEVNAPSVLHRMGIRLYLIMSFSSLAVLDLANHYMHSRLDRNHNDNNDTFHEVCPGACRMLNCCLRWSKQYRKRHSLKWDEINLKSNVAETRWQNRRLKCMVALFQQELRCKNR